MLVYAVGIFTTKSVNIPSGSTQTWRTTSGDVMIAHVVVRTAGNTITAPGWNQVLRLDTGSSISDVTYMKVAGSTEPASYVWSFSTAGQASGGIASYIGVDTSHPVDASRSEERRVGKEGRSRWSPYH